MLHMSSFVDDSMFAHTVIGQAEVTLIRFVLTDSPGAKSDIYDCHVFAVFVVQLMVKALPFDGLADDVGRHMMELTVTAQLLLNCCRQQEVNQRGMMLNSCSCRLRRCQSRMHH